MATCKEKITSQISERVIRIGVLALQGAFEEHCDVYRTLGVPVTEVRTPGDLEGLDGIVIPGGESTAFAIIGRRVKMFEALRQWRDAKKPIWGTCAGLIVLSDKVEGQKKGGQVLVGGLDVTVARNFFGAQVDSFEMGVAAPPLSPKDAPLYPGIFIRAPAILRTGPSVKVLAAVDRESRPSGQESDRKRQRLAGTSTVVAVQQGTILGTAFHPELTDDTRWHQYFLDVVTKAAIASDVPSASSGT